MSIEAKKVRKSLGKNILADGFEPILDLTKSHESWIVDERNGEKYLDMFSMYASGSIGYNHPEILAQKDNLAEVSLFKPTLSDIGECPEKVMVSGAPSSPDHCLRYKAVKDSASLEPAYAGFTTFILYMYCVY